jgi:hypothetical protein
MTTAETRDLKGRAFEIKFLVDPDAGARIRDWARARLDPDRHGEGPFADAYRTSSLYFETPDFDVYHRRGSFGRSKYRVRRYDGEQNVFVERKLRRDARLSKRRTLVALADLPRVTGPDDRWDGRWFARRLALRQLHPVCVISYDRTAREALRDTGRIRLTLDENIRAAGRTTLAFDGDGGKPIVEQVILELKYHVAMPAIFKQLVEEFRLTPCRASKYRFAAEGLGLLPTMGTNDTAASTGTYA